MPNTAQNPSVQTAHLTLHNPSDSSTVVYQFDTLEAAKAFQQKHCLSAYRIAYVELFDDAVENGGA